MSRMSRSSIYKCRVATSRLFQFRVVFWVLQSVEAWSAKIHNVRCQNIWYCMRMAVWVYEITINLDNFFIEFIVVTFRASSLIPHSHVSWQNYYSRITLTLTQFFRWSLSSLMGSSPWHTNPISWVQPYTRGSLSACHRRNFLCLLLDPQDGWKATWQHCWKYHFCWRLGRC